MNGLFRRMIVKRSRGLIKGDWECFLVKIGGIKGKRVPPIKFNSKGKWSGLGN